MTQNPRIMEIILICCVSWLLVGQGSTLSAKESGGKIVVPAEIRNLSRDIFQELIEINTTHANGITKASQAMANHLKAAGYPEEDVKVLGPLPHKQNLVARLRGRGLGRPILFIAHLDVVEARKEDWSADPFRFIEKDGFFYGRGTTDVKHEAADLITNFIRLRKEGFVPDRDIIVALTDDEEAGAIANGVEWLIQNQRSLIEPEYCVNTDAGGGTLLKNQHVILEVQTGEKVYLSFELEVKNRGGHSSLPVKDNAIYHLAQGLTRLSQFEFPVQLNDTARGYFDQMSSRETGQVARDMKAVARKDPDLLAAARLAAVSPYYNALIRTTCVATELSGGHAENALPQTARAVVNCRLLPGDAPEEIQKTLITVLADPVIKVNPLNQAQPSPLSPLKPEVVQGVEEITRQMWPEVVVTPVISTGASDGVFLRRAGIPVYGISGMFGDIDDTRAHGRDERMGVQEYYEGVEFMYRLMKRLASTP
jgi:acetylornithine deacetylase/succinyl-diaminopimelate desuccinylase-like protein